MAVTCPKCQHENPEGALYCSNCAAPLKTAEGGDITKTLNTPKERLQKGSTIAERYTIIEELGRGGMGVVYKAEDTKLRRTVALKFLPPELLHVPDVRDRFTREAQAAAALDHPNICTVYELDQAKDTNFISMAYIEGQSLRKKIESGSMELEEALRIAMQVAEGLKEAHKKGIVHRDIKSANIMIDKRGQAKIMDFGLARMTGTTLLTQEGAAMGTIAYMSPEQAQGEDVDQRSDIWSLGIVMYEMLTGKLPFRGEHEQAIVYAILKEKPAPITNIKPDIPVSIEQVVNKALEKDPDKRYQQAEELLDDLKSISAGMVPDEIKVRLRREKLRRRRKAILYAGAAGLAILLISMIFIFRKAPEKSIAVVPFHYLSDEPDKQYLSDGVMEAILLNLSKIGDLRVISRTSVEQYRDTDKTVSTICHELGVAYLLEGSFQKYGDTTKLIVQLIEPGKERQIWANEYDRDWKDIFSVQSEVAQTVARELRVAIAPEEKQLIEKIPTTNMTAYDAYLKGHYYMFKETEDDLDTALHFFDLAIEKDPEFALAYTGVFAVWIYRKQGLYVSADEADPKAMAAIQKAYELDSTLAEVHLMMANMHWWIEFDWKASEESFKKAISIDPNHARAHACLSWLLTILGRPEEAMEHIERAITLDPYHPFVRGSYASVLLRVGRYDDCISVCREIYENNPTDWGIQYNLFVAYRLTGRYEESLEAQRIHLTEGCLKDFDHVFDQYEKLGYIGTLKLEIETLLEQSKSKFLPPNPLAELYLYVGDKERALDCLEQTYEMRDPNLPLMMTGPDFESLRDEPRFQALLRKMNLPPSK